MIKDTQPHLIRYGIIRRLSLMGKIRIFGNMLYAVSVNKRAVLLELKEVGEKSETDKFMLDLTFLVDEMTIPKKLVLARRKSINDGSEDTNHKLYQALSEKRLSEEVRSELSDFLISEFDQGMSREEGTIREEDLLSKLCELLGISR